MRQLPFSFQLMSFKQQTVNTINNYTIWFLLNGSLKINWKGSQTLNKKDIIFFDVGAQVAVAPTSEHSILSLSMNAEYFRESIGLRNPIISCAPGYAQGDYEALSHCLSKFAEAFFYRSEDDWAHLMSYYYELIHILQGFTLKLGMADTSGGMNGEAHRMQKLENYIHAHYEESLTLKELAGKFYLSPTYLSKYFTKNFGINFYAYLQNVRLENAIRELLLEKSSIVKAALNNGFSSLSAFNIVFKRKYGMPPAKYLKMSSRQEDEAVVDDAIVSIDHADASSGFSAFAKDESGPDYKADEGSAKGIFFDGEASVLRGEAIGTPWQEIINLDNAAYCLNNEFQNQLITAQKVLHFRSARISGIIELLVRSDSRIVELDHLNFSDFNRIVNFLLSIGVKPFFELGNKPVKLDARADGYYFVSNRYDNLDEKIWEELIQKLVLHCVNYWGIKEVASWKFELWIQHSETLTLDDVGIKRYARFFQITQKAIKSIVPEAAFGGPGLNLGGMSIFSEMELLLKTMRDQQLQPDFLSAYLYPSCDAEHSREGVRQRLNIKVLINSDEQTNSNKVKNLRNTIRTYYPYVPVYLTEFSSDAVSRSTVNETCYKSAFIIKTAIDLCDKADALGYWLFSDLTQEHQDAAKIVFGGNGLVSRHGIRKCGYFAFWFLSKLGNKMLDRGKNYIVTMNADGGYSVIVHNYKNLSDAYCTEYFRLDEMIPGNKLFMDVCPLHFHYTMKDVQPGKYAVKKYTLNAYHGNLADLASELNCWELARDEEIEYLSRVCVPRQQISFLECEGELELETHLEPLEVILFTIDKNFR